MFFFVFKLAEILFLKIHSRKCMLWILSPAYAVWSDSLSLSGLPRTPLLSSEQLCQGHSRDCHPADGIESSFLCAYASFLIFFFPCIRSSTRLPPPPLLTRVLPSASCFSILFIVRGTRFVRRCSLLVQIELRKKFDTLGIFFLWRDNFFLNYLLLLFIIFRLCRLSLNLES